jgi:hypothetical protein
MTKAFLRFVGDVHGNYGEYLNLIAEAEYSIQVGDLGLDYTLLRRGFADYNLPDGHHVFLRGNHDCMQEDSPEYFRKQKRPKALEDFGLMSSIGVFYVSGAWSIDGKMRREAMAARPDRPPLWWEAEELSPERLEEAVELYAECKPNLVVTHECPYEVVQHVTDPAFVLRFGYSTGVIPTRTNQALQRMLEIHRPKWWLYGHYHKRKEVEHLGTRFVCLAPVEPYRDNKAAYLDLSREELAELHK